MVKKVCRTCRWWTGKEWKALGKECKNPVNLDRWHNANLNWDEATCYIKPGGAKACKQYEEIKDGE